MTPREQVSVLLVDDDDVDVMSVRRAFTKANAQNPIHVARDGREALELLRGNDEQPPLSRPYIILLDLNMPGMDGLEFLRELRSDADHHDAVVFVLTTSTADQDRAASYDKNVAGYILKSDEGDGGFLGLVNLLDCYWRVVILPS